MDLGYSNAAIERMRDAIRMLPCDPTQFEHNKENTATTELLLQGTELRDVLLKSFLPNTPPSQQPHHFQDPADAKYPTESLEHESKLDKSLIGAFSDDMRIRSWAKRYSRPNPLVLEGDPDLGKMNRSQVRAIAAMIGERISLVQGVRV